MEVLTFVARPVEVQAIRYTGNNYDEIKAFCNGNCHLTSTGHLVIETTEGTMPTKHPDYRKSLVGYWIVRGVNGEFYPVSDRSMQMKYEVKISGI